MAVLPPAASESDIEQPDRLFSRSRPILQSVLLTYASEAEEAVHGDGDSAGGWR